MSALRHTAFALELDATLGHFEIAFRQTRQFEQKIAKKRKIVFLLTTMLIAALCRACTGRGGGYCEAARHEHCRNIAPRHAKDRDFIKTPPRGALLTAAECD